MKRYQLGQYTCYNYGMEYLTVEWTDNNQPYRMNIPVEVLASIPPQEWTGKYYFKVFGKQYGKVMRTRTKEEMENELLKLIEKMRASDEDGTETKK